MRGGFELPAAAKPAGNFPCCGFDASQDQLSGVEANSCKGQGIFRAPAGICRPGAGILSRAPKLAPQTSARSWTLRRSITFDGLGASA